MAGEIVIDAASGGSGHSTRDARMRDSILEVQRYPDISFAPQQVESHGSPPGVFPVTVRGVMVLHGGQHPLTISAQVGQNGDSVNIQCSFVVPYVAWGLKDPSLLFFKVAKEVGVQVSAVAHLTWILVPAPGH
jgi:polyisoprenoid-binding protein YceI